MSSLHSLLHRWPEIPREQAMQQLKTILHDSPHLLKVTDRHGRRPLHEAIGKGDLEMLELILKADGEVDAMKRGDWTPLMMSCLAGNPAEVNLLLSHGADLRRRNREGWTPFHLAVKGGCRDTVSLLELHCQDLPAAYWWQSKANNGRSCLFTAVGTGNTELFDFIAKHDTDHTRIEQGMSLLSNAVASGNIEMVEHLLCLGFPVNDQGDWQPIHVAAFHGNKDILSLLLSNHADRGARTREGYLPWEVAEKTKQSTEIIELLK